MNYPVDYKTLFNWPHLQTDLLNTETPQTAVRVHIFKWRFSISISDNIFTFIIIIDIRKYALWTSKMSVLTNTAPRPKLVTPRSQLNKKLSNSAVGGRTKLQTQWLTCLDRAGQIWLILLLSTGRGTARVRLEYSKTVHNWTKYRNFITQQNFRWRSSSRFQNVLPYFMVISDSCHHGKWPNLLTQFMFFWSKAHQ